MPEHRFPLIDILKELARQIREVNAAATADGSLTPVMKFKECEVELAVEVEKDANGKVAFWVVELGGGRKRTDTHTVKITYDAIGTAVAHVAMPSKDIEPPSSPITKRPAKVTRSGRK